MEKFSFLTADGFRLSYRIEGIGIPVLIIGSSLYYSRIFSSPVLRKNFRLIFMDHRGFGDVPADLDSSLDAVIDDIENLRDQLGIRHLVVIGHSGHGYMALEYAKKYPHSVSHVVLIGMGPDQSPKAHQTADVYFEQCASHERKRALADSLHHLPADIAADPDRRFMHFCLRLGPRSWYDYDFDARPLWEGVKTHMPFFDKNVGRGLS